jgi:hypothetical protein
MYRFSLLKKLKKIINRNTTVLFRNNAVNKKIQTGPDSSLTPDPPV